MYGLSNTLQDVYAQDPYLFQKVCFKDIYVLILWILACLKYLWIWEKNVQHINVLMLIINNDNFISCPCNSQKATRSNHLEAWNWCLSFCEVYNFKISKKSWLAQIIPVTRQVLILFLTTIFPVLFGVIVLLLQGCQIALSGRLLWDKHTQNHDFGF